MLALYRYLGRTPSRLLALALTDAVGDVRTQNQPGTTDEYPNWRVPLAGPDGRRLLLEDVFTDPRAAASGEALRNARESRGCNRAGSAAVSLLSRLRYVRSAPRQGDFT